MTTDSTLFRTAGAGFSPDGAAPTPTVLIEPRRGLFDLNLIDIFKRAFRTLLPPEILAKRKHGFGVPTSEWLKSHPEFRALARDTLLSARARQRGYFRPGALEQLFERHATDGTAYYGDLLWTVLMLELWQRRRVDGAAA